MIINISIQVENSHQRRDGMIADYCDGQAFQQHPLFSRDPCALQIILYYDEVEVVNPLGSKTSKHKVGNKTIFLYFIVLSQLNLHIPRSKQDTMYLLPGSFKCPS